MKLPWRFLDLRLFRLAAAKYHYIDIKNKNKTKHNSAFICLRGFLILHDKDNTSLLKQIYFAPRRNTK